MDNDEDMGMMDLEYSDDEYLDDSDDSEDDSEDEEASKDISDLILQFESIQKIHEDILQRLTSIQQQISVDEFEDILDIIYEKAVKQIDETGTHNFGEMIIRSVRGL